MNLLKPIDQSPILVSGAHRSGTTWVGKMLSAGGQVAYISEPLNVLHRLGVFRGRTEYWYTYICEENENQFIQPMRETLAFKYHLGQEITQIQSFKDLGRMARDWSNFTFAKILAKRPLIKDPFAIFSVAWFAERLNCQILITVRHPAAFASSLKKLGWHFDFNHLLQQPLLMCDHLKSYRMKMKDALENENDIIQQAGLLWSMVYQVVWLNKMQLSHFRVVRYEDLASQPVEGFRDLYANYSIAFSRQAKKAILRSSSSKNPKELNSRRVHSIKLDSRSSLQSWKRRLTPAEIQQVRSITEEVAQHYYSDTDWE